MNTFVDVVFIFIFVFVIMHFKIIDITTINVITQKLFMFIAVTAFATLLSIMKSIRRRCSIDMWKSINSGVLVGLLAFIGHTIFFDMHYMTETRSWTESMEKSTSYEVTIALFIAIMIILGRATRYIFTIDDCDV